MPEPSARNRRQIVLPGSGSVARLATLAVVGVVLVLLLVSIIPGFPSLNPFATETKDRSQPVVVKSLEKLSEYRAATANLQVIVDLEEDAKLLPSFIKGEKVLFVAAGSVDAKVDFSKLKGANLKVSNDRKSVEIIVPAPTLTDAVVDPSRSRVYDRDRGVLDRIEGIFEDNPADETELFRIAKGKLKEAAAADPALLKAAETNTRDMLTAMMAGLGFEKVTITFLKPPAV